MRLNRDLLAHLMEQISTLPRPEKIGPATLDGLLNVRGVIETAEAEEDEAAQARANAKFSAASTAPWRNCRRCATPKARRSSPC